MGTICGQCRIKPSPRSGFFLLIRRFMKPNGGRTMNNLIWEKWQQTRPRSPHGIPGQPEFRELGNGFSSEARDYLSQLPLIDLSAIGCELICGQDNVAMIWLYNNYCWGLRMNEYGRAQVTYMPNPTCLFGSMMRSRGNWPTNS